MTPARDGLLNVVASGRIQRTVMLTSIIQFGLQVLGFLIASFADRVGPELILGIQSLVLLVGVIGFLNIRDEQRVSSGQSAGTLLQSIAEGARTVDPASAMLPSPVDSIVQASSPVAGASRNPSCWWCQSIRLTPTSTTRRPSPARTHR